MQAIAVQYKNLIRWDVKSFLLPSWKWDESELVPLGSILKRRAEEYKGAETPTLLSIHFDGELTKRKTKDLKGRVFMAHPGDVVYSKIDVRNGAIGIVPETYGKVAFTSEFPIYEVDTTKINSLYLQLILKTSLFNKLINSLVSGSSGRKRVNPESLEGLKIPMPSLAEQKKIIVAWKEAEEKADGLLQKASETEQGIEGILFGAIGFRKTEYKKQNIFLIKFQYLERWDAYFYRKNFFDVIRQLSRANGKSLGQLAHFVGRPWKESDFPDGYFRYVQISDVEEKAGITSATSVKASNAPSRATQIIKSGDLIISTTRPYLAAFAKVGANYDNCVASSGFSVIDKVSPKLDKDFLLLFLKSFCGIKQFEQRMTGGSYPAITQEEMEKILIPLPPLAKQMEIVTKIEKMRAQAAMMRHEAEKIRADAKAGIEKLLVG